MEPVQIKLDDETKPTLGYKTFQNRKTDELVFAFVEPIGGGAKDAIAKLKNILESTTFNYTINTIDVSDIIKNEGNKNNLVEPEPDIFITNNINSSDRAKKIYTLQQWGNTLREKFGADFLAKQIIRKIATYRRHNNGFEQADESSAKNPKPLRVAHIIRSLKHNAELELLKAVYGSMLIVIAISGSYEQHLNNHNPNRVTTQDEKNARKEFDILTEIDQFDGKPFGQRVRKIFYKSNIFLKNDEASIKIELNRFLRLLFELEFYPPRHDERMMYEAFAASMMSTCLSRQVGAAISTKNKELLATGWNDVPRYGGGLAKDIEENEKSALCKSKGYCNSNKKITELVDELFNNLSEKGLLLKKAKQGDFKSVLLKSSISHLIEFSRAIHAEMEAILSVARENRGALHGSSIYVTTYPCENCVKHILAAGIDSIYYIEPYPKSRAKDFFPEFITDTNISCESNKLQFKQFVGIAPISFTLLYTGGERKNQKGELISPKDQPSPKTNVYLDSFTIYEQQIAKEIL